MLRWGSVCAVVLAGACVQNVRFVDDDATGQMDGSFLHPYNAIGLAVEDLDARGGGTVVVADGVYALDEAIRIDSAISLIGAGSDRTFIVAGPDFDDSAIRPALIQVGCTDWQDGDCPPATPGGTLPQVIRGVTIRDFTLEPGDAGRNALVVSRVQGLRLTRNAVRGPAYTDVSLVATSGVVNHNTFSGAILAVGVHAGYPGVPGQGRLASPANVFVVDNTFEDIQTGVMLFGSASGLPQWSDGLRAHVSRNLFRGSAWSAIRVVGLLPPDAWPGSEYGYGTVEAVLNDNDMVDIPNPYVIDAGMPYRRETVADEFDFDPAGYPACSDRWYTANLDIDIEGGSISNPTVPLDVPVEISFARPFGDGYTNWQFLHHATFDLTGDPALFAAARINHPEYDPYQDTGLVGPVLDGCKDQRLYDLVGGARLHPGTPLASTPTPLDPLLQNTLLLNSVVAPHSRTEENGVTCIGPLDCIPTCGDGVDTDGDGLVDADDPDCADTCNDQMDNDADLSLDGSDLDSCHATCGEALSLAVDCTSNPQGPVPFPVSPYVDPVSYCLAYTAPLGICDAQFATPLAWLQSGGRLDGGAGTDAYYQTIECALASGCPAGAVDCIVAVCFPKIQACQQTLCQE